MKKTLQLSTVLILSLVLSAMVATAGKAAPSDLTVSTDILGAEPCPLNGDRFVCPSGTLYINGTDYPHSVHVVIFDVTGEAPVLFYEGDQIAPQGDLSIPQGLSSGVVYQVTVSYGKGKNTDSNVVLISVE